MNEKTRNPTVIQQAIGDVGTAVKNIGWAPLAGCAALYLAHIRHVEKQAGTTPRPSRNKNRTIGRDYEW